MKTAKGKKKRRLPTLAFVTTLLTGCFFFLFGLTESISGFASTSNGNDQGYWNLLESAIFGLPMLFVAWVLWVAPKPGAFLLILTGFGYLLFAGVVLINLLQQWWFLVVFILLPIFLGIFTLIPRRRLFLRRAKRT